MVQFLERIALRERGLGSEFSLPPIRVLGGTPDGGSWVPNPDLGAGLKGLALGDTTGGEASPCQAGGFTAHGLRFILTKIILLILY